MFPFFKISFLWVHLKMYTQIYVFTMTQYLSYNFKEDYDRFCSNHTRQNIFSVLLNFWIVSLYSLVHVIG